MHLYRFSPITDETAFQEALEYITEQLEELSLKILGEKLPVSYLKLFTHYPDEYTYLHDLVTKMGPESPFTSKTSFYAKVDKTIKDQHISYIGVRIIDPYRMQVGCGDYEVEDFESYKEKFRDNPFVRYLPEENMLEIWQPDFDVLGYVIPKEI